MTMILSTASIIRKSAAATTTTTTTASSSSACRGCIRKLQFSSGILQTQQRQQQQEQHYLQNLSTQSPSPSPLTTRRYCGRTEAVMAAGGGGGGDTSSCSTSSSSSSSSSCCGYCDFYSNNDGKELLSKGRIPINPFHHRYHQQQPPFPSSYILLSTTSKHYNYNYKHRSYFTSTTTTTTTTASSSSSKKKGSVRVMSSMLTNNNNTTTTIPNDTSSSSSHDDEEVEDEDFTTTPSSSSSIYYNSNHFEEKNWEEWISMSMTDTIEYKICNPWDITIFPLLDDIKLDNESRFIVQLLNDRYQNIRSRKRFDFITTERCNTMISKLLNIGSNSNSSNTTTNSHQLELRAHRAHDILQAMELFWPMYKKYYYNNYNYSNSNDDDESDGSGSGDNNDDESDGSGSRQQQQFQQQQQKLPVPFPVPNHETYWNVLKLYSSKYLHGSRNIPLTCQAIVKRMESLAISFSSSTSSSSSSSSLQYHHPNLQREFQPSLLHWNLVLASWANSHDPQRPIEAAQLLYQLHASSSLTTTTDTDTTTDTNESHFILTDESSFSHTLRACSSLSQRGQVTTPEFEQLAREVAVRVWTVLLREQQEQEQQQIDGKQSSSSLSSSSIVLNSFLHVHFLRACRNFPTTDPRRDGVIRQTFQECCRRGKVNPHVLQEFITVASSQLVHEILSPYYDYNDYNNNNNNNKNDGTNYQTKKKNKNHRSTQSHVIDPLILVRNIPSSWVEHADGNKYEW